MAVDDRRKSCRGRIQVHFSDFMDHIEEGRLDLHDLGLSKGSGPFTPIHIPLYGNDRSQLSKGIKHQCPADVARMDDKVHPIKDLGYFRSHESVGV